MRSNQSYLVCIRCSTYNHAPYIEDALNGFTMQQTTFPYIAMVVDDASIDGEQEVITSYVDKYFDLNDQDVAYQEETDYAHITYAQHKTNKNCYIVVLLLKENHYQSGRNSKKIGYLATWRDYAKYEALCEGDDYWIDPLKLQKQVDFLEANSEYGMCYTNFNIFYQDTNRTIEDVFTTHSKKFPIKYNSAEEFVLKGGYVCPPSWVFRRECLPKSTIKSVDGTLVLFTHFLCTTKVYGMIDTTTIYRVLSESASHSLDYNKLYKREKGLLETQYKLIDEYNLDNSLKRKCEELHYKRCLPGFVANNKTIDIQIAERKIINKAFREQILFLLSRFRLGRNAFGAIYRLLK